MSEAGSIAPWKRGRWLVFFWVGTRMMMLCAFWALFSYIRNDVTYYAVSVLGHPWPILGDIRTVLVEYPSPVVWFLQVLGWFSGGTPDGFVVVFAVLMAALDALACVALFRFESRRAAWAWAVAGALLGPLMWFRLDLVPALCVLGALYWMHRRPALAGVVLALGAGLKLWPALLILPMLGTSRPAQRRFVGFTITGTLLAACSLAGQGLARTVSPLSFQSQRGLQIESVWATPLMLARLWSHGATPYVEFSSYQAYEVFSPSVHLWEQAAGIAMLLVVLLALVLCWLIGFGGVGLPGHAPSEPEGPLHEDAMALAALAVASGVMICDKTLSPQYMMWIFAPLGLVVARTWARRPETALRIAALGALSIWLTQLVYPLSYAGLISRTDPQLGSTVLLTMRNISFVALSAYSCYEAVRAAELVGRVTVDR